eukprot:scaffold48_cov311-Pinguiococcus_pyrenoidosus.AAC.194
MSPNSSNEILDPVEFESRFTNGMRSPPERRGLARKTPPFCLPRPWNSTRKAPPQLPARGHLNAFSAFRHSTSILGSAEN